MSLPGSPSKRWVISGAAVACGLAGLAGHYLLTLTGSFSGTMSIFLPHLCRISFDQANSLI
jgi:hypothetical protein